MFEKKVVCSKNLCAWPSQEENIDPCENALRTLFDLSRLVTAGEERKKKRIFHQFLFFELLRYFFELISIRTVKNEFRKKKGIFPTNLT